MLLIIRLVMIVAGIGLFVAAALIVRRDQTKPYASGADRVQTFYDDAKVLSMRIAGVTLVSLALLSWVVLNHPVAAR